MPALSSPDPAEVGGETKENAPLNWPRIFKTEGVAIGVAFIITLIAPIFFKIILSCFGFTCRGNVDETLLYDQLTSSFVDLSVLIIVIFEYYFRRLGRFVCCWLSITHW